MSFSERKGLKKARTEIQVDTIDNALRNRLWNVLDYYYWSREAPLPEIFTDPWRSDISKPMLTFLNALWHYHFKEPIDTLPRAHWSDTYKLLRTRYFEYKWYEVYDFIEFLADRFPDEEKNKKFMETCNSVLEVELSAYRFVGEENNRNHRRGRKKGL